MKTLPRRGGRRPALAPRGGLRGGGLGHAAQAQRLLAEARAERLPQLSIHPMITILLLLLIIIIIIISL